VVDIFNSPLNISLWKITSNKMFVNSCKMTIAATDKSAIDKYFPAFLTESNDLNIFKPPFFKLKYTTILAKKIELGKNP
jgi:hypothetical protein